MSELLNINKKISYAKTKIKFLERKLSKYKKEETAEKEKLELIYLLQKVSY